jgi:predicted MFS family arabinose efflux permease
VVQGAGSALMIPQVLSILQRTSTGEGRVRALSVYSAVLASGPAVGQSLGGVLVSADLFGTGWRPVFLVNVPIGVLMLLLAPRVIPRDRPGDPERRRGLDVAGLVVLGAAVTLLTVPLVLGQQEGWPLWGWLCLGLSAVVFGLFVALEARLTRRGGAPLVSGRVLRAPGMPRAVAVIALTMAVNTGFLFAIALHLQSGLGDSALHTGLTFLAAAVTFGGVGLNWRRLYPRWYPALPPAGLLVAAAGFAALGLLLRGGGGYEPGLLAVLAVIGLGLGLAFSPTFTLALGQVRPEDAAEASGLLTSVAQLLGVSTFGTLFLNRLPSSGSAQAITLTAAALTATAAAVFMATALRRPTR